MSERFQFSIFNLLLVTAMAGIGVLWLTPVLVYELCPLGLRPHGTLATAQTESVVITLAATTMSSFLLLWIKKPTKRITLYVVCGALCGQMVVLLLFSTVFRQSRMTSHLPHAYDSCRTFAEGEEIYHRTDYNKDGVLEYATTLQELLHSPDGIEIAMVDRALAAAESGRAATTPKAGYVFKVFHRQGPNAPGGAKSYFKNGTDGKSRMTEGYAIIAFPAQYNVTGRYCYMFCSAGISFGCDLGPKTMKLVEEMTEFDPDPKAGWVTFE